MKIKEYLCILLIYNNEKILMVRPKNPQPWERYSPLKIKIMNHPLNYHDLIKIFIDFIKNEFNIILDIFKINKENIEILELKDKKGRLNKKINILEYHFNNPIDIGLNHLLIEKQIVQNSKFNNAFFMDINECIKYSLKNYIPFLKTKIK